MDVEAMISRAGKELRTVQFSYVEEDGSNEGIREVEPYSYRDRPGVRLFFGYDIAKDGIRSFKPEMIQGIAITNNNFTPRWPVEV
jgi:predicted DNA-binding transcriptional regulator YafY